MGRPKYSGHFAGLAIGFTKWQRYCAGAFWRLQPFGQTPHVLSKKCRSDAFVLQSKKSTGRPNNPGDDIVFWSHYSDVSNEALYPFGFGLSYTQFDYSGLSVESLANQQVRVKVNLKNSGLRDGEEVAQLYLNDHFSSFTRPIKELKGFQKKSISNPEKAKQ